MLPIGCASTKSLAQLPLVVYSGRDLSPEERSQLTLGPTYFLAKTRVQPQQLEALVLTMLRSSRATDETPLPESAVPNRITDKCRRNPSTTPRRAT